MRGFVFALIPALFLAVAARAAELSEYRRPVPALGMGGVHLPWVDTFEAPIWNPAQLNEVGEMGWKLFDLGLGSNGVEMYETYKAALDSGCSGAECLDNYYGKPVRASTFGGTTFVMPSWGITIFTASSIQGVLDNPALPNFNLTYLSDYGFATGVGFPVGPGLSGGVTLKRINRRGGNKDVSITTIGSLSESILDEFSQRGTAYGMDAALMYRTPGEGMLKTTAVLTWQDVGWTAFVTDPGAPQSPEVIRDNVSAAVGVGMDLPGLDWKAGVEWRQITNTQEQLGKKLHFGGELSLPLIDLRAGLNQGYPTLGLGMDIFLLRLDVASYMEEVGVYPGQTPSQRIDASLSMSFAIDANFKFTTKDGRRRDLKQRR